MNSDDLEPLLEVEEENTEDSPNNQPSNQASKSHKMIEIKKIPAKTIILDIILLYTCAVSFELLCQLVGPVQRGFFCNDESIRYPYKASTVSGNALFLYCFNVVLIVVLIVEWYLLTKCENDNGHYSPYEQGRSKINRLVVRTFIFYGYFQIAFAITYILTDLTKISVGRLRPHFLDMCQPNVNLTACMNSNVFINDYECLGPNKSKIREARLSFFSGHSSLSMVASTFAVLYLHCRLQGKVLSKVLLPVTQMSIFGMGMFISYSRIWDNMHHWSDVAVGMTVGVTIATLTAIYVAKLFHNRELQSFDERKNLFFAPSYSATSLPATITKNISGSTDSTVVSNNDLNV